MKFGYQTVPGQDDLLALAKELQPLVDELVKTGYAEFAKQGKLSLLDTSFAVLDYLIAEGLVKV